jgi:hypothetical protein
VVLEAFQPIYPSFALTSRFSSPNTVDMKYSRHDCSWGDLQDNVSVQRLFASSAPSLQHELCTNAELSKR